MLAPDSRNRRAGEMLGSGRSPDEIRAEIGQASEGLDSVPQIAETIAAAGLDASAIGGLATLIEGEIGPEEWIAGLRRAERSKQAA